MRSHSSHVSRLTAHGFCRPPRTPPRRTPTASSPPTSTRRPEDPPCGRPPRRTPERRSPTPVATCGSSRPRRPPASTIRPSRPISTSSGPEISRGAPSTEISIDDARQLLGRERREPRVLERGAQRVLGDDPRDVAPRRDGPDAPAEILAPAQRHEEPAGLTERVRAVRREPRRRLTSKVRLERAPRQPEERPPRVLRQSGRVVHATPIGREAGRGRPARNPAIASPSASRRPSKKWSAPGTITTGARPATKRSRTSGGP